jgi:hypothetical protein
LTIDERSLRHVENLVWRLRRRKRRRNQGPEEKEFEGQWREGRTE